MKRLLLLLIVFLPAVSAAAQAPAQRPSGAAANVEVDPIRCWWRTSTGAIRIGEAFDLSLTCATLENEAVQVVPDESHLDSSVVAMAPFEVIRGSHPANLRSGQRRFFQYQYTLRIINPDAIGKDVPIPDTVIHYKVNSRIAANTALQGRDLVYILPTLSMRVASMVPADATDIRDQAGEDFATIDTLDLRAGTLEIVGIACIVLGALMTLFVLIRLARRAGKRTPADERTLSTRAVAGAANRELAAVQRERERQGWTETLAGRALAAIRITAACVLARPVSQRLAETGAIDGAGRVIAPGPVRGKRRALSSPVTAPIVARYASAHSSAEPDGQQMLDELRSALAVFSLTQYGRTVELDQTALDGALASARAAAARVKRENGWVQTAVQRLRGRGAPVELQA